MYELTYSVIIFLSVLMVFFGYIAGSAKSFNFFKLIFLLGFVAMLVIAFNHSQMHLIILAGAFAFGYFLPHMHILSFIGESLSDFVNAIRYRSEKKAIKQKEKELEAREELLKKLWEEFNKAKKSYEEAERQYRKASENFNNEQKQQSSYEKRKKEQEEFRQKQKQQKSQNNQKSSSDYSKQDKSSGKSNYAKSGKDRVTNLKILGLDPNKEYSASEVRKKYKRLALKYHPDRHKDKSPEELRELNQILAEINKAYEWLKENS